MNNKKFGLAADNSSNVRVGLGLALAVLGFSACGKSVDLKAIETPELSSFVPSRGLLGTEEVDDKGSSLGKPRRAKIWRTFDPKAGADPEDLVAEIDAEAKRTGRRIAVNTSGWRCMSVPAGDGMVIYRWYAGDFHAALQAFYLSGSDDRAVGPLAGLDHCTSDAATIIEPS